jgi:hypothetical protein
MVTFAQEFPAEFIRCCGDDRANDLGLLQQEISQASLSCNP